MIRANQYLVILILWLLCSITLTIFTDIETTVINNYKCLVMQNCAQLKRQNSL